MANRWKFPQAIVDGIRHQLNPLAVTPVSRFAALINLADYIVHMNEKGDDAALLSEFPNDLATSLGINLVKMLERIDETKELAGAFDGLLD
ncbi:MAG: hypothetical protein IPK77_09135 [Cellvibrio sp.]|nr:hypothetical protein [Cellvibrio sp.]